MCLPLCFLSARGPSPSLKRQSRLLHSSLRSSPEQNPGSSLAFLNWVCQLQPLITSRYPSELAPRVDNRADQVDGILVRFNKKAAF
ncbi:hypothetical protein BT93_A1422 [Corymbia citriodora subsp. variegata]|nr:hypothetical protein BT93_A1422 [Corymbia citriodora subsp. variegata]